MTKLIADSGATKTEWRITGNSSNKRTIQTEGLNPYYHTTDSIIKVLKDELIPKIESNSIKKIFFYGAGCDNSSKTKIVEKALHQCFNQSEINVYHDLLAAARACCMDEPGVACILGTGSNSCRYDGEKITEHIPSLAFILGDEGSAGYFGKKLINSYFRCELPDELAVELEQSHNMNLDYIMENLYKKSQFSRFIASYSSFLGVHKNHPFVEELLCKGFENFITRIVAKYSGVASLKVSFVGSVARAHQGLIEKILNENDLKVGRFIQNPTERLVEYHTAY